MIKRILEMTYSWNPPDPTPPEDNQDNYPSPAIEGARNMRHTPGPWKIEKRYSFHSYQHEWTPESFKEAKGYSLDIIGYNNRKVVFLTNNDRPLHDEVTEANARLITTAPELLEALERLVLAFDIGDMMHTTINGRGYAALVEGREAIAKAKEQTDEEI